MSINQRTLWADSVPALCIPTCPSTRVPPTRHSDPERLNAYVSPLTSREQFGLDLSDGRQRIGGVS